MSQLQTYIFGKPNNQIIRTHRRSRRQNYQTLARELEVTVGDYHDFEIGRRGLALDRFQRLELDSFQERLCLRVNCRSGERRGVAGRCPTLDPSLEHSLDVSEQISRRTKITLSPGNLLVQLTSRYQTTDDFARRIRRQLIRWSDQDCQSDQAFYDRLTQGLARHRIHVLTHPLEKNCWGYSLSPPRSIIVVNRGLPPTSQIYSLIAQLADLLSSATASRNVPLAQLDQMTNNFAAHFIVPLQDLKRELWDDQLKLDRFYQQFRGSSGEIIRRQLGRLRSEASDSRRLKRLVSLLSLPRRHRTAVGDNSLAKRLIDWNGRVYLDELASQIRGGRATRSLAQALFGYQPDQPAECRVAVQLLNDWDAGVSRRG